MIYYLPVDPDVDYDVNQGPEPSDDDEGSDYFDTGEDDD